MPEYLAPGVFVEEVSFRAKSIEGVSTTTTGFIGGARTGPVHLDPDIVTSLTEFEEIYGTGEDFEFTGGMRVPNFLWHAVRAFFTEGGKRLYICRIYRPPDGNDYEELQAGGELDAQRFDTDGYARWVASSNDLVFRARHPGSFGNGRLRVTLKARGNILSFKPNAFDVSEPSVGALEDQDLVWVYDGPDPKSSAAASPVDLGRFYVAKLRTTRDGWDFESLGAGSPGLFALADLFPPQNPPTEHLRELRIVRLSIRLSTMEGREIGAWSDLPLSPTHRSGAADDSIFDRFHTVARSAAEARRGPLVISRADGVTTAAQVLGALFPNLEARLEPSAQERLRRVTVIDKLILGVAGDAMFLSRGHDGVLPTASDYEGRADSDRDYALGLKQFEDIEDISIVAAPGSTWNYGNRASDADAIMRFLIAHAELMRYRIAVLDSAPEHTISEVRDMRGRLDSKHAALYYPWVRVLDPITRSETTRNEIDLPPSGFVAGIYARNDIERGVWKAPANEVVRLALSFETLLNKAQQEVLNPEGINCFRYFEGRGMRLWGARTISSDPEWKYVNVRRYFAYLERSIDKGTQWAVFEPNGEQLWSNVRRTIEDFLLNEWQSGALLGDKPEKAFFVRCDRTTMTQNDLDNGRMICLIGVAPLKPAEFVIFRIGQWTSDRKS